MSFCVNCGKEIGSDFEYCPECGTKVIDPSTETFAGKEFEYGRQNIFTNEMNTNALDTGKWCNKWISLVLCLFFGYWGVHRFYEGKVATGIIYILTFAFCGIGVFVDLIIILSKPNPYKVK